MSKSQQKIWDYLRKDREQDYVSTGQQIAAATGAKYNTARAYLHGLNSNGYMEETMDGKTKDWFLIKDTGPIAPKWNHTPGFRDWNLDPMMTGEQLTKIKEANAASTAEFIRMIGFSDFSSMCHQFSLMMRGKKPVSYKTEYVVRKLLKQGKLEQPQ